MNSTPKKLSLRLTPRESVTITNEETPKKVRFSVNDRSTRKSSLGRNWSKDELYTAEDALTMLNDSSLSEIEISSDEEWIVTKPRNISALATNNRKDSPSFQEKDKRKTKSNKEVVSPLKLLRKPEYEVNKLPSACKKSESAVSPIIIKRKTDIKTNAGTPLAPSSRNNVVSETCTSVISRRTSLRARSSVKKYSYDCSDDDDVENKLVSINKRTPNKQHSSPERSKAVKKLKEKQTSNGLEKTLEDKINELCLQTPKKNPIFESKDAIGEENLNAEVPHNAMLIHDVSYMSHRVFTSPIRYPTPEETEINNKKSSQKPRPSRRASQKAKASESDHELENPSPPKRRALRTPKHSSPVRVQRSARKSSQKALSAILSKEDELELSSPDEKKTPKRSIRPDTIADSPNLRRQVLTPKVSARKKLELPSPSAVKKVSSGYLTPHTSLTRRSIMGTPCTPIEEARIRLHTGTIPESLPCRDKEFNIIFKFLSRRIEDKTGGCMYISGVPGTGKTATVTSVIRSLEKESALGDLPKFDYVELNGLRLTEPRQAYVNIWQKLSGQKLSGDLSFQALEKKFQKPNRTPCVILIDELDYLCNKRQDVIYNILEWSTKETAALIVLTIANTMDLAERTLKGKINSRMGLHKVPFMPYTYQELQKIVMNRIQDNPCFHPDAVQFVARKVAAVSGDARRALDICRRATELVSEKDGTHVIKVTHINEVMAVIFAGQRVKAIMHCSTMEKCVLKAILMETKRTGVEETNTVQIQLQLQSLCPYEGLAVPVVGNLQSIISSLADSGLVLAEDPRADLNRKVSLNVSEDDIHFALMANDDFTTGPS